MDSSNKGTSVSSNQEVQRNGARDSNEHNQRDNGSVANSNTSSNYNRSNNPLIRWYRSFSVTIVEYFKKIAIPIGAVSSTFLMSGFSKAYAETTENDEPVGFVEKFFHNGNIENNPFSDKGINFNVGDYTPEQVQGFLDFLLPKALKSTSEYALGSHKLLVETLDFTISCLQYIYSLITTAIISTPALVFNSSWFAESYLKFAGLSFVIFTLCALWNAGRKTFNLSATSLRDIVKRYILVVTGIGFGAFLLQQFFKVIKFISEIIVAIGYSEIHAKDFATVSALTTGDTIALVLFNIVLIGMGVTIMLQNGRRWWQLTAIGLTSSWSLSTWVFDGTRKVFKDVKEKFIKLSLTQIYHAAMISLMGFFLVGTAGAGSVTGLLIKLSMILGGFSIMIKPPVFFDKWIDSNTENVLKMYDNLKTVIDYKLNPAFEYAQQFDKAFDATGKGKSLFNIFKKDFKI